MFPLMLVTLFMSYRAVVKRGSTFWDGDDFEVRFRSRGRAVLTLALVIGVMSLLLVVGLAVYG